ncbi:MAG TPA: TadE/TadG family type IV pilus assembly protein [Acidimicrobiales bacterium]|jgi:Flp pilus assembly protein TadG
MSPASGDAARRGDEGLASTTVALVMPLVLLLLTVIVQYGLYYNAQQRAAAAADRAISVSRWADATEEEGEAAGMAFLKGAKLAGATVDVNKTPDEVTATVTGTSEELIPFEWAVSVTASAPVERFIPEPERERGSPPNG